MKAIVTGANGFIGSALVKALIERHYDVSAISRVNTKGLFFLLCGLEEASSPAPQFTLD
jgi:nucleoside-diphosphate-sugar epimerase